MAGFGKILKKIDPSQMMYEREKVKYEKLSQDPHDNEAEDDDVVFSQDGVVTNGHTETLSNGHNGVHLERAKILKNSDVEVKVKKLRILTKYRALCFCCIILLVVAGALFFALIWPLISRSKEPVVQHHYMSTPDWTHVFERTMTESCIRVYDVDGDGRDDVILGMEDVDRIMMAMQLERKDMEQFCQSKGETMPCMGQVVALRGFDGTLLWSFPVYGTVFELNCGKIDVNQDGRMDCIGTGRIGSTVAFDPKNGNVFWREDLDVLGETWNTYQVLILPDVTGDGVAEVLLPNGGDPKFAPQEHIRYAGRLILLDGATGRHIGRALEIVDAYGEKETYMSPVMHTMPDGSMYILYGSGGETVRGSLYIISVPDFYRHVKSLGREASVPDTIRGKYRDFPDQPRSPEGIIAIYNSSVAGVMVPPVCVDMDSDGVKDILMSAYDGTVTLFNGKTLAPMWTRSYPGYECYSTPAPGYLNDDDVPDFMFHINKGTWDEGYKYSLTVALDGKTGHTLLRINSSRYEMASDLVAMTTEKHRDAFVFRIQRLVHGQVERKKRQLFNRQFPSQQDPPNSNPYGYGDRDPYNRYGYPQQPEDDEPYGYGPSYNGRRNKQQQTDFPSSPYTQHKLPSYADRGMYGSQPSYSQGFGTGFQNYRGADDARTRYGDDDPTLDDPRSFYYDADSLSNFPGVGSQYDYEDESKPEFEASDIDRPKVFHPEHEIRVNGNEQCVSGSKLMRVTELYIVDRSTLDAPIRLLAMPAYKTHYNLTKEEIELAKSQRVIEEGRVRRHGTPGDEEEEEEEEHWFMGDTLLEDEDEMCSVMTATERNAGAIGDFDGDGDLDLIYAFEYTGQKHDKYGSDFLTIGAIKVIKMDLKDAMKAASQVKADLHPYVAQGATKEEKTALQEVTFKQSHKQLWTAYLGGNGDSIYGRS